MEKKTGIELIAEERQRQIEVENHDVTKDVEWYNHGEIIGASLCYSVNALNKLYHENNPGSKSDMVTLKMWDNEDAWPWHPKSDKREKHDVVRSLVIAGALIAAELDRLSAKTP